MSNKLLITGGTGSFGTAFLKKAVANNEFSEIRIFSRDEKKQDDMRNEFQSNKIKYFIGDVRDLDRLKRACKGIDYLMNKNDIKVYNGLGSFVDKNKVKINSYDKIHDGHLYFYSTFLSITIFLLSRIISRGIFNSGQ